MPVADQLIKLRLKYGWSQDEAANLAGVAPTTWFRAERSDAKTKWSSGLRAKTLRTMMETLLACAVPISLEDAHAVLDAAGISRAAVRGPAHGQRHSTVFEKTPTGMISFDAASKMMGLMFQLAALVGESRAEAILRQIVEIPVATPIPTQSDPRADVAKRYLRVVDPPVRRPDGAVEEVSRGYELAPPTPPAAQPARRSTPGKM